MPPRTRGSRSRALAGAVALGLAAPIALGACGDDAGGGSEQTAAGFCTTMREQQQKLAEQINGTATDSVFNRVLGAAASPALVDGVGDYFRALADAAPDEVRSDADAVADAIDAARTDIKNAAGTPLNTAIGDAIRKAGIRDEVTGFDEFIRKNCGMTAGS